MENQNPIVTPPVSTYSNQIINSPKSKMKLWKKIIIFLITILIILGITFYNLPIILTALYPEDSALIDNSSLLLNKVSVADGDNAFFDLDQITNEMIKVPEFPGGDKFLSVYTDTNKIINWDQKLVDRVLNDNKEVLSLFDKASDKNNFQVPSVADPANIKFDGEIPRMNTWRDAGMIQAINAVDLAKKGKTTEALAEALKINKMGHMIISGGNNSFIGVLVGIALKNLGSKTIIYILQNNSIKNEVLFSAINNLNNINQDVEGYKNSLKFEYLIIIDGINKVTKNADGVAEGLVNGKNISSNKVDLLKYGYYYKINQTKNLYTELYKNQLSMVGTSCSGSNIDNEMKSTYDSLINKSTDKLVFEENLLGKSMFYSRGSVFGTTLNKICQVDLLSNITLVQLALKAYQNDNKKLPQTLNELVPKYLNAIPEDPFDHKPIRYSVEKKILYSVGLKQKDLGGSVGDDWTKMDNPTFKINF